MADWSPERIESLERMWLDGLSASQIAQKLGGLSRSAVIGKVYRLGLTRDEAAVHVARMGLRPKVKRTRHNTKPRVGQAPRKPRENNLVAAIAANRRKPGRDYSEVRAAPVDASLAKPWLERKFGECAYPISGEMAETHSCCQPTEATYCPAHARLMFRADKPTMKKTMRISRLAA